MNSHFSYTLDKSLFPANSEFSFTVKRFGNEIAAAQAFSKNNAISCQTLMPGLYHADCIIKTGYSLAYTNSGYRYIPPERTYDLFDKGDLALIDRAINRSSPKGAIECFKVDARSQIHDFIYFPSTRQRLFILCPSAIIRGKFPVPYFYRWSWAADGKFPGNVIALSDPTFLLDPHLEAGWLVGARENDATKNFASILNIFCKTLKIPYKNLVFWGSSAGGFIAMQLSAYFPGSTAVAVNAQTDIFKYETHGLLYKVAFPGMGAEEINAAYPERLSTLANIHRFKRNRIFMAQNIQDSHHYKEHFMPFMATLMNEPAPKVPEGIWKFPGSEFTSWLYSSPNGHEAETEEMAGEIIKRLGY